MAKFELSSGPGGIVSEDDLPGPIKVEDVMWELPGGRMVRNDEVCDRCWGDGRVNRKGPDMMDCPNCNGRGTKK